LFGHIAPEHAFQARVNLEQPLIEEHRRIIGIGAMTAKDF
jgi:hypothetical protein